MAARKRLLLVATEFPPGPGGIAVHGYQLARHAGAAGWDVTVLAPQEYVSAAEAEQFNAEQPFTAVRLATERTLPTRTYVRTRAVNHLVDYIRPDVVVASGNWAVWLTAISPQARALPRLAIGHGMEFGRPGPVNRRLNLDAYGSAAAVVCVSNYTRMRMDRAGVDPPRVLVVPNGGDEEVFRPADGPVAPFPDRRTEGKRVILSVGNVSARKGQDIVIRALPELVDAGIDVHYVVVGLPTRAEMLRELAASLHIGDRVHFFGRASNEELLWAYQAADVFAMTSREVASGDFEGYGIAVVEAALCGKPAIVTGGSGLAEAVVDGVTGLVVRPEDPGAFATAARALLTDEVLRRRLGDAALERARETATWTRRMRGYLALLDVLAASGSVARDSGCASS